MNEPLRPDLTHATPSRVDPWKGRYGKTALSGDQQHICNELGLDWKTVETIACTKPVPQRDMWAPPSQPRPVYEFACPVLKRQRGKVLVITPAGARAWIREDGQVTGRERVL